MSENGVDGILPNESNPWGLHPDEEAMLDLVASGCDHARIADELSISVKTVRNKLSLLRKRLEEGRVVAPHPDSAGLAQAYKYIYRKQE